MRQEADYREDNKSSENGSPTIDDRNDYGIPVDQGEEQMIRKVG